MAPPADQCPRGFAASATGRTQAARYAAGTALRHRLQSWLDVVEQEPSPDRRRIMEVAERFTPDDLTVPLKRLNEHLSTSGLRELAPWPDGTTRTSEIESYRRLVVLMNEFNQQFAAIPAAAR